MAVEENGVDDEGYEVEDAVFGLSVSEESLYGMVV